MHRRPGEARERQRYADRPTCRIHSFDRQNLSLLELCDQLGSGFVVRHAAIGMAVRIGPCNRLALVDGDANASLLRHLRRQCDPEDLGRFAVTFNENGGSDRPTRRDTVSADPDGVSGVEAGLRAVQTLRAEFDPRGVS